MSEHSWEVRWHEEMRQYFLYLDAGKDPGDGAPLTYATPLHPDEAVLWQQGEKEELARRLRRRGIPLPGPCGLRQGKFRRFLQGLRRNLLGGR